MALSIYGEPTDYWTIPFNAVGPFSVDSWGGVESNKVHRVIGISGFQVHGRNGEVVFICVEQARAVCDAANSGLLLIDPPPELDYTPRDISGISVDQRKFDILGDPVCKTHGKPSIAFFKKNSSARFVCTTCEPDFYSSAK